MTYQIMKRHITKAKEPSLESLHTVPFQLSEILEKARLCREIKKVQCFPEVVGLRRTGGAQRIRGSPNILYDIMMIDMSLYSGPNL